MIDVIGYVAGALAMISFLPQVVKTLRTRRADDLSMPMLLLTLSTNVMYVIYGLLLQLYPVVIMLGIMTAVVILLILLTARYS